MKFMCTLLAVKDIEISKEFYGKIFDQEVVLDLGANVTFSGGFAIQQGLPELIGLEPSSLMQKAHNFELYFEVEDFDAFLQRLEEYGGINYVHTTKKYQWQQRVVRIYDPDLHIIEIGESMASIARKYLSQGYSVEETSKIIMHPVEFVKSCI